jgi:NAD(P)-dependent dehydrogenase (short-subunit alcohol dehydrogenase family)
VEAQVRATIDAAIDHFGRLDVVANNAGLIMTASGNAREGIPGG